MKYIIPISIFLLGIAVIVTNYDIMQLRKTISNNNKAIVESNRAINSNTQEFLDSIEDRFIYLNLKSKCNGKLVFKSAMVGSMYQDYENLFLEVNKYRFFKDLNPKDYNCVIFSTKTVPLTDLIK
jgi:hypothetical protein